MKIAILLPSDEQKKQAGVRIRYERIKLILEKSDSFEFVTIQDMTNVQKYDYDVYIISKCYDSRAIILAHQLTCLGKLVGVDLFDDYFSLTSDSRFIRFRYWLDRLLAGCSFILCSTSGMERIAQSYAPNLPVHILNDPAPKIDIKVLDAQLTTKLENARRLRRIEVAWFGMGDNPNFLVGLADLAAFSNELGRLRGYGYDVQLEILTNKRAMTANNLALLTHLAIPYNLQEWSEIREADLLARSLLAFLPVNAQNFSRVKSLNRAITALVAGAQVLSVGYPLYKSLNQFIYRDSRQFIYDLQNNKLALRSDNLQNFLENLKQYAEATREAKKLNVFLQNLKNMPNIASSKTSQRLFALIHGKETSSDIHKFTQKRSALSVASPQCKLKLNFDVRIQLADVGKGLEILVSTKKMNLVAPELKPLFKLYGTILNTEYQCLFSTSVLPHFTHLGNALVNYDSPASHSIGYGILMSNIYQLMYKIFPNVQCFFEEHSKRIPWDSCCLQDIKKPKVRHDQ